MGLFPPEIQREAVSFAHLKTNGIGRVYQTVDDVYLKISWILYQLQTSYIVYTRFSKQLCFITIRLHGHDVVSYSVNRILFEVNSI